MGRGSESSHGTLRPEGPHLVLVVPEPGSPASSPDLGFLASLSFLSTSLAQLLSLSLLWPHSMENSWPTSVSALKVVVEVSKSGVSCRAGIWKDVAGGDANPDF